MPGPKANVFRVPSESTEAAKATVNTALVLLVSQEQPWPMGHGLSAFSLHSLGMRHVFPVQSVSL